MNLGSENRYFKFEKGKALGPLTQKGIEDEIRAGRILAFDLLFKNRSERWQPVHEFDEFREILKTLKPTIRETQWVVLSSKSGDSTAKGLRLQQGPMTSDEVKSSLNAGLISYRDFIWREGEDQWRRISDLEEFNPTPVRWKPAYELPGDFLEEIDRGFPSAGSEGRPDLVAIKNVRSAPVSDVPPSEALQRVDSSTPKKEERRRSYISPGEVTSRLNIRPLLTVTLKAPRPKAAIISALVVALGVVGFFSFYTKELKGKWRQIEAEIPPLALGQKTIPERVELVKPEVSKPQVEVVLPKAKIQEVGLSKVEAPKVEKPKDPTESKTPPKPEAKVAPTELRMTFGDGNIRFDFNGSSHFIVEALIYGEAGQILERVSLYRRFQFRWKQDELRQKSFADLGLPEGEYRIEAQVQGINADGQFRVGRRNSEFERKLARHRKLISLPYQREKRNLTEAIESFMALLRGGQPPSVVQLRTWRRTWLRDANWSKVDRLVFPERWFRLNAWVDDLARGRVSPPELLGRLKTELGDVQRLRLFGSS